MRPTVLAFVAVLYGDLAARAETSARGDLTRADGFSLAPAFRAVHESDDHIDLDGQDLDQVELTDEEWSRVANLYAQLYGQSDWPRQLPAGGPSAQEFADSFYGIWLTESAGFSPAPLASISDYRTRMYLRDDQRLALHLQVTERNPDGSASDRVLMDQLQIGRIYVKFSPDPVAVSPAGGLARRVLDGIFHVDYLEDYDCPCAFAEEPFEVTRAARVFESPPLSRTYYFRTFPGAGDRLVVADALKSRGDRTIFLRIGSRLDLPTSVTPSGWGAVKRAFRLP